MTVVQQGIQERLFSTCHSCKGLALLLQAYEYAKQVGRDVWDFAVEIPVLQQVDFSLSDVRWLVCKGYAQHARETTAPGDACRSFRHENHLALRKRSCVVLTEEGVAFARQVAGSCRNDASNCRTPLFSSTRMSDPLPGAGRFELSNGEGRPNIIPYWDCVRQELRLGPEVVKVFKLYCPNQATILACFEEERWPTRIDDPLPRRDDIEPKQRLHDTIKSLNRNQKSRLIRFRGDGTGQGIRWELSPIASQRLQLDVHSVDRF